MRLTRLPMTAVWAEKSRGEPVKMESTSARSIHCKTQLLFTPSSTFSRRDTLSGKFATTRISSKDLGRKGL